MPLDPDTLPVVATPYGLARGVMRTVIGPTPGPGADVTITAGDGAWIIRSVRLRLTTAVAAGNREVVFTVTDGQVEYFRTAPGATQGPSLVGVHQAAPVGAAVASAASNVFVSIIQEGLLVPQGGSIVTATTVIQGADQIDQVRARVIELPVSPDGQPYWIRPTAEVELAALVEGRG